MTLKDLDGLTDQEKYLSLHIRAEIPASPKNVTGGDTYDPKKYNRDIEMEHAWGERASEEREALFAKQSKQYLDLFGIAQDSPFAPHKD